jgi:2-dehydropantoate 2-reductase
MRILVVGAGAIGGYFGGRLLEQGGDVTFLVRPRRAAELGKTGLIIRSRYGDVTIPTPKIVLAENLREQFDLILLSCKAYDLESAIASFMPAVGANTAILPLLNGMGHLDVLDDHFGAEHVLGGQCMIAVTLDANRVVTHLNDKHGLTYGERDGSDSERIRRITELFSGAKFDSHSSHDILLEMWEKWVFLATLAGSTCTMRASIADILASPGGKDFVLALLDECRSIAAANGHAIRDASYKFDYDQLTAEGSTLTASMLRDVESNARIEGDHIIGDLLRRGRASLPEDGLPLLALAYTHLKSYEARRARVLAETERSEVSSFEFQVSSKQK